jgi:hypothetical protein
MLPQNDLVIIVLGHKQSPFVESIVDRDDIPVVWICSNVLDFQLYHADPAKSSTYHLEFTNLLELKARNYIESFSIFETLGKFLEFYNPLKISTLNYLITKYITSLNPSLKGLLATWMETVKTIFDGNSILPLFEEGRVLHVKLDDVEIPARQYIITKESEKKKENGAATKPKKKPDQEEIQEHTATGIIDLEEIAKLKLCSESIKRMGQSFGVLIVPTDLLSLHMLTRSEELMNTLKTPGSKITLLSPFWVGGAITIAEKEILERTSIEPSLLNLANKLKDFVDTIVIDEKDSDTSQKLRDMGMNVLVEKLDPEVQKSEQFLDRIFKSVSFDLNAHKRKRQTKVVALGEKIVSILSERFSKKESIIEVKPSVTSPPTLAAAPTVVPATDIPVPVPATSPAPAVVPAAAAPVPVPATSPAPAVIPATAAPLHAPAPIPVTMPIETIPVPAHTPTTDEAKIEEIAPNLLKDLDRVLLPKYDANMEGILSALLAVNERPRLLPSLYKVLVNKQEKLKDLNPESRTIDIITYLAAHNPGAFTDLFSEMISDAMKQEDIEQFGQLMHMVSLIMGASQVKQQEVLRNFIKENIGSQDGLVIERARKLLNYFTNKDPRFAVIICKTLIELLSPELESPKPNVDSINNLVFFLLSIDALLVGETIVTDMPEAVHPKVKSLLEAVSCGRAFNNIVINIIDAYQVGEYEALKKALNVKKVPAHVQMAVLKRKYVAQLLKVGSVPLEMFANKLGMTVPEAEKLIYEMIMKGDISAKMEVVGGKLYIVKDEEKDKEAEKIA